ADVTENRVSDGRLDTTNYQTFGAELTNRTEIELGVPIRLTFGAEFYQDQQEATRNGVPRVQAPDATAQYAAVFAQGDIELTETLTLTPGVRFDYFSLDPSGAFQDRSDSEISPKLALQWRPTDSVQLWVSASQSFRAPSLTELYVTGTHFSVGAPFPIFFPAGVPFGTIFSGNNVFLPTPDLKPERANQIEIGGRLDDRDVMFDGDRLIFSANGYYARVDDYVDTVVTFIDPSTFVPGAFGAPGTVNGSTVNRNVDANLWGFEAEVTYDAADFFLGAGVTIPRGGQRDGAQLGSIPQDRITLTGGFRPIDDLEIGARATLMSGQKRTASTPTSGTALFDLFATWTPTTGALDGAFVSAGIDNLTDRTYRIHGNGLNQPGIAFKASAGIEF
ncbi:MAG: TonB-dependent receptor, partial [Pseudomonadota bacterium]